MNTENRKNLLKILSITIVFSFFIGLSGCQTRNGQDFNKMKEQNTDKTQDEPQEEIPHKNRNIRQGYNQNSPIWKTLTSKIKEKTGETLESFTMPESSLDSKIIFFSTSAGIDGKDVKNMKSKNKIYSYNLESNDFKELYSESENQILRTIGIEGDKLILMRDFIDNSPGPCFSLWSDWRDFSYLDIENNTKKLEEYVIPAYQIRKGKAEKEVCEKELQN